MVNNANFKLAAKMAIITKNEYQGLKCLSFETV